MDQPDETITSAWMPVTHISAMPRIALPPNIIFTILDPPLLSLWLESSKIVKILIHIFAPYDAKKLLFQVIDISKSTVAKEQRNY